MSIAVGIVEDHPVYLQGLAGVIDDADGLDLVLAARTIEQFDDRLLTGSSAPSLVMLDLHLSGGVLQKSEAVAHLRKQGRRVLVVSSSGDRESVLDAIAAGAAGYVTKDAEADEIVRAVQTVASGETYVSPTLAGYLLHAAARFHLTPREKDVLRLLAAGDRNRDIAEQLHITENTVRSNLDRIRDKTGLRRRAELTQLAIRHGLVEPRPK